MSYELERDEDVAAGIRRIADEQVEQALESLEAARPGGDDPGEAIHDARKRFKKVRAVLRLVRPAVGEEWFDPENVAYRDAGRELAAAREWAVLVETVDALRHEESDALPDSAWEALRSAAVERRESTLAEALEEGGGADRTRERVGRARARIAGWPVPEGEFDVMAPGLRKVYERGRRAMDDAYDDPSGRAFHEWRKRVKYLWYHIRILAPAWCDVMEPLGEAVHDVSDYLGDGNDLTDLLADLEREPGLLPDEDRRASLVDAVTRRRAGLWEAARPLGMRLYHDEPDAFVDRVGTYWEAMRHEVAAG